ncbi:MAG: ATP-binding protein [Candidatus Nanohalobium sp.]
MDRQELIREVQRQNKWWDDGQVNLPEPLVKREIEDKLEEELDEDIITAITGLRRAGKTTLLKKMVKTLLEEKKPKNILYFSFDLAEETDIRSVMDIYSEEILSQTFENLDQKVYIFLDEVQKLENWSNQIKSIQDRDYNIKFVVTGSASTNITKGAGESLVGRIMIHRLHTFSFKSYLKYNGIETSEISLEDPSYPSNSQELRIQFNEYMDDGGFPELYDEQSNENLQQNLDLTLFRDIVNLFTVKRSDTLKQLFRLVTEHTGQVVNYNNLSQDLDTQYRTVTDYLQYLEDGFLINTSKPVYSNTKKSMRKNPKIYTADHAYNRLYPAKEGLKAETIAYNHLKRIEEPGFKKDPEVDIILPEQKKAFEIKYPDKPSRKDARQLTKLPEDHKLYLVTRKTYDTWQIKGREVEVIPLWMLCLATSQK